MRIPLAAIEISDPQAAASESPDEGQVSSRRVLIVEDNSDAAITLELLVQSLGHTTRVEHNGHRALAAAVEFRPNIVLLDIGLPGMDGYEIARQLRASAHSGALRLIAVTGWGQDTDKAKAAAAGFDTHLVKPLAANELARVLAASGEF